MHELNDAAANRSDRLSNTTLVEDCTSARLELILRIHCDAFPNHFMTQLGRGFLRSYYRIVLEQPTGILLIAVDAESFPVGFVAGFLDAPKFYAALRRNRIALMLQAAGPLFRHPTRWGRLLYNRRRVAHIAESREDQKQVAELCSIAVDPTRQGQGIGGVLMNAFEARARELGASLVNLTTDAEYNDAVNRFYQGLGYCSRSDVNSTPTRPMHIYSKGI